MCQTNRNVLLVPAASSAAVLPECHHPGVTGSDVGLSHRRSIPIPIILCGTIRLPLCLVKFLLEHGPDKATRRIALQLKLVEFELEIQRQLDDNADEFGHRGTVAILRMPRGALRCYQSHAGAMPRYRMRKTLILLKIPPLFSHDPAAKFGPLFLFRSLSGSRTGAVKRQALRGPSNVATSDSRFGAPHRAWRTRLGPVLADSRARCGSRWMGRRASR